MIINEGGVVAEGTPEMLTAELQQRERIFVHLREPAPDIAEQLSRVEGVADVQEAGPGKYQIFCALGADRRAEISSLVVGWGWGLLELRPVSMSLEEIFLHLTTVQEMEREEGTE